MVEENDVFVGVSYSAKLQYEELRKAVSKASDSLNKFSVSNKKYEELLYKLSEDLTDIHGSFESIFEDLNKSAAIKNDVKQN
jgi:hypothetical protein